MAQILTQLRPWSSEKDQYTYADKERWVCIYPIYINSRRTEKEGRRIPKDKGVDNPTIAEMRDVCTSNFNIVVELNKVHPRELDKYEQRSRGRLRVQLLNEDGSVRNPQFPTRKSVMLFIAEMIPKLKTRQGSAAANSAASGQSTKKKR